MSAKMSERFAWNEQAATNLEILMARLGTANKSAAIHVILEAMNTKRGQALPLGDAPDRTVSRPMWDRRAKMARAWAGISQGVLADLLGFSSRSTIAMVETGRWQPPPRHREWIEEREAEIEAQAPKGRRARLEAAQQILPMGEPGVGIASGESLRAMSPGVVEVKSAAP